MPDGIDVWMMTVRCGSCERPMTLSEYQSREGGWNRYVYLCERGCAGPPRSLIEVPRHLDHGTRRREEVDYAEPPADLDGPWNPRAEDLESPEEGVFVADPPEEEPS